MKWLVPLILYLLSVNLSFAAGDTDSVWQGVYSGAQADRGREQYSTKCASCHGSNLEGQGAAVALRGTVFLMRWNGQTLRDLFARILTTMPQDDPGSLSQGSAIDIVTFLLQANGFPPGASELTAEMLKTIKIASNKP